MRPAQMFLAQHALLHSAEVTGGLSMVDRTFGGLTDEQMRLRPWKGGNSLAWLLWHMARTEDVNVNLVVVDGRQVFDDGWARRLNVSRPDIGTGMTAEEVADLGEALDIASAREYRNAVGRRTRDVVAACAAGFLDDTVSPADVARASAAGAIGARAEWVVAFWQNQPRATRLATVGITHNALHLGEAQTLRSIAGLGAGR
jgi:hypothetical protein